MSLTRQDIIQVLKLARLSGEHTREGDSIQADLEKIMNMVNQISQVKTDNVSPMSHPLEAFGSVVAQPLRKDEVTEEDKREAYLKLAPQAQAGLYLVPPVIEEAANDVGSSDVVK